MDLFVYDFRLKISAEKPETEEIVLVEIDGREFANLKERFRRPNYFQNTLAFRLEQLNDLRDLFYWDPQLYSIFLGASQRGAPKAILFTLYFPRGAIQIEKANERFDRNSKDIDWLNELQFKARSTTVLWSSQFDSDGNFIRPADELSSVSNFGFNNMYPDRDGVTRRTPLLLSNHASLALAASYILGKDLSQFKSIEGAVPIRFVGPAGTFRVCQFHDFIRGPEELAKKCPDIDGKILIVGKEITKKSQDRIVRTPVGEMSRAELLANAITTLSEAKSTVFVEFAGKYIVRVVYIVALAVLVMRVRAIFSTLIALVFSTLFLGVFYQLLFVKAGLYLSVANDVLAILATYIVFIGYKMSVQEVLQWQTLRQTQVLREVDRIKTNFLSLFSHDLKTPIAKIQGIIELLLREQNLDGSQTEHLKAVLRSNNELKDYITNILSLSRVESNPLALNKKSNDINRTIEGVLERLEFLAKQKAIIFKKEFEPMFSLDYDDELIKQVVTNIVDNAIKHCPENTEIRLRTYEEANQVFVEVIDNGPGIKPEELSRLFKKFTSLREGPSDPIKSSGLGLYLARFFVEMHGGRLEASSPAYAESGRGCIFRFSLPLS